MAKGITSFMLVLLALAAIAAVTYSQSQKQKNVALPTDNQGMTLYFSTTICILITVFLSIMFVMFDNSERLINSGIELAKLPYRTQ